MPARLESRSVFPPANVKCFAQPARRGGRKLPLAKTFGVRSLGRGDALRPLDRTPFSFTRLTIRHPSLFALFRLRAAAWFEQLAQTRRRLLAIQPAFGNT